MAEKFVTAVLGAGIVGMGMAGAAYVLCPTPEPMVSFMRGRTKNLVLTTKTPEPMIYFMRVESCSMALENDLIWLPQCYRSGKIHEYFRAKNVSMDKLVEQTVGNDNIVYRAEAKDSTTMLESSGTCYNQEGFWSPVYVRKLTPFGPTYLYVKQDGVFWDLDDTIHTILLSDPELKAYMKPYVKPVQ